MNKNRLFSINSTHAHGRHKQTRARSPKCIKNINAVYLWGFLGKAKSIVWKKKQTVEDEEKRAAVNVNFHRIQCVTLANYAYRRTCIHNIILHNIHTNDRTQTPDPTMARVIINFTDDDKH